ncbi:MAG: cation:proton antiporter, partial [Anaerolineales bacterium]|nr:cation:proton antiporter [Anaerolineales bacterium]
MEFYTHLLIIITGFIILALASNQIGHFFTRFKLPLISGFLVAGILFGPYGLDFIHARDVGDLHFVDEVSLAFIAFAAGSELYLKELRSRFKSITWVTIGLVVVIFTLTTTAVFLLASYVPFMRDMPNTLRLAVALLAGAILVARSPSSAIAIVN